MRTTLLLMAATAAPLYAQQAASAPVEQTIARLAAPAQTPAATAQQRAAALPALSLVPADSEMAFAICNIGDTISQMGAAGLFPLPKGDLRTAIFTNMDSFAIAASEGTSDLLTKSGLIMNFSANDAFEQAAQAWVEVAQKGFAGSIRQEAAKTAQAARKAGIVALADIKVRPVYAVLTVKPGAEDMLKNLYAGALHNLQRKAGDGGKHGIRKFEAKGYKGISFRLPKEAAKPSSRDTEFETALKAEMSHRTFYVLLKMEGDALVGVFCENPDEINLPKTPEQSILGTNKLAGCDAHLHTPILTTGYMSPELLNAYAAGQLASYKAATQTAVNIFKSMAGTGSTNNQVFSAAAAGIDKLSRLLLDQFAVTNKQPEFHQIWLEDNSIEAEWKMSANPNVSYMPGKLSLAGMAKNPSTILYAESTGVARKNPISWNGILDAAADVANGVIRTLNNERQTEASEAMGIVASYVPDAKSVISALSTIHGGLGGNTACIIDCAGSVPAVMGGEPGNMTAIPRLSFYSGVKDRSKIGEGWKQLLGIAGDVATRMGQDPAVVQMLPIVPMEIDNATSYMVALPWFTKDLVPNVTLNNGHFAMGTSSELNAQVVGSATGSVPFSGAICTLKLKPLADMTNGIAAMLRKQAEAEKAAEKENAYVEDAYGDYAYYEAPTPADEFEPLAQGMQWLAGRIDALHAMHTINGDTQTIRVSITTKK